MYKYGFSRTTGVSATTEYEFCGQLLVGAAWSPTNTSLYEPPFQVPRSVLRVKNCCCVPESMVPSIFVSAMKPPLAQPLSHRLIEPLTCTRRNEVPCDTPQISTLLSCVGTIARFST